LFSLVFILRTNDDECIAVMNVIDSQHTDPDYSVAYVVLETDTELKGYGLTFTVGRGTEIGELHKYSNYTNTVCHMTMACEGNVLFNNDTSLTPSGENGHQVKLLHNRMNVYIMNEQL